MRARVEYELRPKEVWRSLIKVDTQHEQIALDPVWNGLIKFAPERETILAQRLIKDQLDTEQGRITAHPRKRESFLGKNGSQVR